MNFRTINWNYMFKEIILFVLLSYFFLIASTHNGLVNINIQLISAILFSILFVFSLFIKKHYFGSVELLIFLFLICFFVSSFLSIDPFRSFTEFWLILIEIFLLLFTANLVKNGWPAELIIKVVLIIGSIFMIFSWIEFGNWYAAWLRNNPSDWMPDISYRLPVPNFMVVVLNVVNCLAIGRIIYSKDRLSKAVLVGYSLSAFFLIYLTSSRGGWLGTVFGILMMILLYPKKSKLMIKKVFTLFKKNWLKALLAFILIVIVLILFIIQFINLSGQPTHAPIMDSRSEFWTPTVNSFIDNPLFGQGPYTFYSSYLQENSVPPNNIYVYAHSIYLDVLSGMGIAGFLSFLFLLLFVWRFIILCLKDTEGINRGVVLGGAGAFAAFCLHGFVDSVHHTIPTSAWMIAILLGTVLGLKKSNNKKSGSLIIIGSISVILFWANFWINKPMTDGIIYANEKKWSAAEERFELALKRYPKNAIAQQQLGLIRSELYSNGDKEKISEAIFAFEEAVVLDPYWALNHANLGSLYKENGELNKAKEQFLYAADLAPDCAIYWLNLGVLAEDSGDQNAAKEYYYQFLNLEPEYVDSVYWQGSTTREQIIEDYLLENPKIDVYDRSILESELEKNPDSLGNHLNLIDIYINENKYNQARQVLNEAKLIHLMNEKDKLDLMWYEAEILEHENKFDDAKALKEKVISEYQKQGLTGPGSARKLLYSELIFRRPSMNQELTDFIVLLPVIEKWEYRIN